MTQLLGVLLASTVVAVTVSLAGRTVTYLTALDARVTPVGEPAQRHRR